MSSSFFFWRGERLEFQPGQTVALALEAAGQRDFGPSATGLRQRYFCGIGACQGCLVRIDDAVVEACLRQVEAGMHVEPLMAGPAVDADGGRHD